MFALIAGFGGVFSSASTATATATETETATAHFKRAIANSYDHYSNNGKPRQVEGRMKIFSNMINVKSSKKLFFDTQIKITDVFKKLYA